MFEEKVPHHDPLEKNLTGNISLDLNLEQDIRDVENHPTMPAALMLEDEDRDPIILSVFSSNEGDIEETGAINLEYYDGHERHIEDDFATFCMLQFNLNNKDDVLDFIKNEENLEKSIIHIDKIYSLNQGFISKQSHDPDSFEKGVFTDLLLSHDMTQDEIAVLFTTMQHFNHHKALQKK